MGEPVLAVILDNELVCVAIHVDVVSVDHDVFSVTEQLGHLFKRDASGLRKVEEGHDRAEPGDDNEDKIELPTYANVCQPKSL